jgi:diguanylate cyclase (GGDEF)-like protein
MEDGQPREAVVYMHHRDGHRVPVSVRTSPLTDENGAIIGAVELFTDISNLSANELRVRELEKMALLDNLTQLANRNYLEKELQSRFEEKTRLGAAFGILFIDIDYFKRFNDMYGHGVGDGIMKIVANTLVTNARPFDLYGRWGGEEFIGIIRNCTAAELESIGNRVRLLVENAYLIQGQEELRVTISLGATMLRDDDTMESLIRRADALMYASKRDGRNRLTIG